MIAPIKVAIVVASPRIVGGHSVQAERIRQGFAGDPTVAVSLVPIDPIPVAPFDRLLRIKYVRTVVTQLLYWPLLFRRLRHADVVHVFSASYWAFLLASLPAILVARLLGKPLLLNYHSGEAPDHLQRSALARYVLRRLVDLTVVPSAFLRQVFASFDIPATVIPNTVDTSRFRYRVRTPLRPNLLSTRTLDPLYNVTCTVRAFAVVQQRHPDATLTIVGGGSQLESLRALAHQLSLRHVVFTGTVDPAEIHRYYDASDIYVQTPRLDNMPLSLIEAFAVGLPVVATRVGGVPAMLTDGVHGLLAPDDDAAAVAAGVLDILSHPAQAQSRAAAARAQLSDYEWPVVRERWTRAYRTLLTPGMVASTAAAARS